jgi:hypothetical protein
MKKEYIFLIGGLLVGGAAAYFVAKNKTESTSSVAGIGKGKQPRRRPFESWEHYKGRLMQWFNE